MRRLRHTIRIPILLFLSLLPMRIGAASEDGSLLRELSTATLLPAEYAFFDREHQHAASNNLFYICVLDDGWILIFDIFHYTFGLFEKWGMYVIPADGSSLADTITHELDRRSLRRDDKRLFVSDGRITFSGDGKTFRFAAGYEDFSCDLSFTNIMPPWKRRDGYHFVGENGAVFIYRVVPSPWARVSGTFTVNGITRKAEGDAYGDRSFQVFPPFRIDPLIVSMRCFSNPSVRGSRWHLNLIEHVSHKSFGSDRDSLLMLARDGEWVHIAEDYRISYSDWREEAGIPYQYPGVIRIESETDGCRFSGTFTASSLFNYTDVLDEVPAPLRPIALLIIKRPVFFRMAGRFSGRFTDTEGMTFPFDLYGVFEYVVTQ